MKKYLLLFVLLAWGSHFAKGQALFDRRDKVVSAKAMFVYDDFITNLQYACFTGAFEYFVAGKLFGGNGALSVGGELGYDYGRSESANHKSHYNGFIVAAKCTYHHAFLKRFDAYLAWLAGATMSFGTSYDKDLDVKSHPAEADGYLDVNLGLRCFVTPSVGVFAEVGLWSVNFGLSYRF